MKQINFFTLLGACMLLFSSCDKSDDTSTKTVKDIYIAGSQLDTAANAFNRATYWKNGQPTVLTNGATDAEVICIEVSGTDVYAGGYESDAGGVQKAKLWKNGIAVPLALSFTGESQILAIQIAGTDVYTVGYEINPTTSNITARCWKNGTQLTLNLGSTYSSRANDIVVSGSDVYITGFATTTGFSSNAVYWKNGVMTNILPPSNRPSNGQSIFVDGADIYIAGEEDNNLYYEARCWKNGTRLTLPIGSGPSGAYSVAVTSTAVYVAGDEFISGLRVGKYWKNGTPVTITTPGATDVDITDADAFGEDVYISGGEEVGTTEKAGYWKNSTFNPLPQDPRKRTIVNSIALGF